VIYGCVLKNEWEEGAEIYYMGDLRRDKLTVVFNISLLGLAVNYIVIYIVIMEKVMADGIIKKHL